MFTKKSISTATIKSINDSVNFNPSQYLTKNGVVCAGSDGRFMVDFELEDGTHEFLSLSSKQVKNLSSGMKGTLTNKGKVFISFDI